MSQLSTNRLPEELLPHEDGGRTYSAIRGKRVGGARALRILFVPNDGTHDRRLPLSDLRLQDCAKDGTEIIMEFSALVVRLTGRNLATVDYGIGEGFVAAVEAFDARRRDMPQGETAPFIERIEFIPNDKPQAERPARGRPRLVKTEAESAS